MSDYTPYRPLLLAVFALAARRAQRLTIPRYGDETARQLTLEARDEFHALIPQIPYIGGWSYPLTQVLVGSALFLALYRVLKAHGEGTAAIGAFIYELVESFYGMFPPGLLRYYGRRSFSRSTLPKALEMASRSQERRYPGDWVYTVVAGDGERFDIGYDYSECGICKFYQAQEAEELVPYLCELDFLASDYFGWGLARTTTLAQDGEVCDFRFKVLT